MSYRAIMMAFVYLVVEVSSHPPIIVEQPQHSKIYFYLNGTNFTPFSLACSAKGKQPITYSWIKNGNSFNWLELSGRVEVLDGGSLNFHSPLPSDDGEYQCFAENEAGKAMTRTTRVILATLSSFPADMPPQIIFANEFDSVILSCVDHPIGDPKPVITWILENATSHQIHPLDSRRHNVDIEGNLHISTVLLADSFVSTIFTCQVSNVAGLEFGSRTMLSVVSSEGNSFVRHLSRQFISPKLITVPLGKSVDIFCIYSGHPSPEVVWQKTSGHQTENSLLNDDILHYGAVFHLDTVTWQDEGVYQCNVSNSIGENTIHTFSIKVVVPPKFVGLGASNVNSTSGSNIVLNCPVFGIPIPHVDWFINGSALNATSPAHLQANFSSLWIWNARSSDTGTYQCNASSAYGYDVTSMYLVVSDSDPQSKFPISRHARWYEGNSGSVNCTQWVDDIKTVKWLQSGNLIIPDTRREILPNGTLSIFNVSRVDGGTYVCIKTNIAGTISRIRVKVFHVLNRTRIVREPRSQNVISGSEVTFDCEVKSDARMVPFVDWVYNDVYVNQSDMSFSVDNNNSLTIYNVTSVNSGKYTCLVSDHVISLSSSAILFVKDNPQVPVILGITCDKNFAGIEWQAFSDNRNPISKFLLQYTSNLDEYVVWKDIDEVNAQYSSYEVSLTPGLNYSFRVIAINDAGPSNPSLPSVICSAEPTVPFRHPNNVTVNVDKSSRRIIISWEPVIPFEHNGPGFFYRVYWRKNERDLLWNMMDVPDWTINNVAVNIDQSALGKYKIKVESRNSMGRSNVTAREVSVLIGKNVPSEVPQHLSVLKVLNSSTAVIYWKPVSAESINGIFKGYKLETWTSEGGYQRRRVRVIPGNHTVVIFKVLQPSHHNNLRVWAFNEHHNGPPSETLTFSTLK